MFNFLTQIVCVWLKSKLWHPKRIDFKVNSVSMKLIVIAIKLLFFLDVQQSHALSTVDTNSFIFPRHFSYTAGIYYLEILWWLESL